MSILITILVLVIGFLALVHGLWGIGFWFPIRDEARLVKLVVGAKDATRMPGAIPCALVSAVLIVVCFALLSDPSVLRNMILGAATAGFLARGGLAWLPIWRKLAAQEPFSTYDRFLYGPVFIAIGLGVAVVLFTQ